MNGKLLKKISLTSSRESWLPFVNVNAAANKKVRQYELEITGLKRSFY
jgi:hypothetical protein